MGQAVLSKGKATKDWGKTKTLDPLGSWTYRLFFKMICVCFAHVNEFVLTQSVSLGTNKHKSM